MRLTSCPGGINAYACSCARLAYCCLSGPELPLRVSHLLEHRLSTPPDGQGSHRHGAHSQPQHRRRLCCGGQGITGLGQRPVHAGQGPGNVQSVARRTFLCLDANSPHTGRQLSELVGDLNQFAIELFIINALENLVISIQSTVETVMGAPPQPLAKLQIVFPSLADGPKETHLGTQRY